MICEGNHHIPQEIQMQLSVARSLSFFNLPNITYLICAALRRFVAIAGVAGLINVVVLTDRATDRDAPQSCRKRYLCTKRCLCTKR